MSLNELLRDGNSNKWANLNVQSVSSNQENTLRQVIKGSDNPDNVIDMSNDTATARIISKTVSSGVLQPYEITSCCLFWRKFLPGDANATILAGTQQNSVGSIGPVFSGRHKMVFATIDAAGAVVAQSGGVSIVAAAGAGQYDITFSPVFLNRIYGVANPAQNGFIGYATCTPLSNSVVRVNIYNSAGAGTNAIFTINAFGDA